MDVAAKSLVLIFMSGNNLGSTGRHDQKPLLAQLLGAANPERNLMAGPPFYARRVVRLQ